MLLDEVERLQAEPGKEARAASAGEGRVRGRGPSAGPWLRRAARAG